MRRLLGESDHRQLSDYRRHSLHSFHDSRGGCDRDFKKRKMDDLYIVSLALACPALSRILMHVL